VLRGRTLNAPNSRGTSTPNWVARLRRCMLRLERTFQLVFRSSRSVCDERRIALTLSASSACAKRGRAGGGRGLGANTR
jgi:hypothetical protein